MSKTDPTSLPDIYQDYLARLEDAERAPAAQALARWNRFLEGRPPEEVDGARREWFELTQEEAGLSPEEIGRVSRFVGRFYDWLVAERPRATPKAVAQPAPSTDPDLPPPPPALARDRNLFKQGPSVGPPPGGPRRPAPIDAQLGRAKGAAQHRPSFTWGFIALFVVLLLALPLPYVLVWSPQAGLEADVETYIDTADGAQLGAFYEWFAKRAAEEGFKVDLERIEVRRTPLAATQAGFSEVHRIELRIPAKQNVLGIERYVTLEAAAHSAYPFPKAPVAEAPVLPKQASSTQGPALTAVRADELLALVSRLQTAIANYRRLLPSVPEEAARVLYGDVAPIREVLRSDSEGRHRGAEVLLEASEELLRLADDPPPLVQVEDRLFQIETRLRQAERYIRADAPSAP